MYLISLPDNLQGAVNPFIGKFTAEIPALIELLLIFVFVESECPIYGNTRPVANRHPSPRPNTPGSHLKAAPSSHNLRTPSPGRRYEGSKLRNQE